MASALAGLLLLAVGAWQFDLAAAWEPMRARELGVLLGGHLALAVPWAWFGRRSLALCLLGVHLLAALYMLGPAPLLAVAVLATAGWSIGDALVRGRTLPFALKTALGLALVGFAIGWTLPLPIHLRALYLPFCLGAVWMRRQALVVALRTAWQRLDSATRAAPLAAAFAMLCLIAAAVSTWLPSLMFDDLAYHLGLPAQLVELGRYRMDAGSQVWAFAPWLGDSLFAAAWLLAGQDSRGALDLLWLLLAAALAFGLAGRVAARAREAGWWTIALFASLPLTAVLASGMQTELVGSVYVLVALLAVLHPSAWLALPLRRRLVAVALAALLAIKLSLLPCALLLWLAWQWREGRAAGGAQWLALPALVLLLGGSAYAYAALFTGNPVLPLANALFASPFFPPVDFSDPRYRVALQPASLWALLFDSARFYESWRGVSGFQWLPLLGPAVLVARGDRRLRALGLLALLLVAIQLRVMFYLRYLHPFLLVALPLLALGAGLLGRRTGAALLMLLCLGNLAYQANASWLLRDGFLYEAVRWPAQSAARIAQRWPELALIRQARAESTDARILHLDPAHPFVALAAGQAFTNAWYDPELRGRADPSQPARIAALLDEVHFTHLLVRDEAAPAALADLLAARGARPTARRADLQLWSLPPPAAAARDLYAERDAAGRLWQRLLGD